jgi:hypothetical protein
MMLLREWRGSQTKEKRLLESKFFGAGSSNNEMVLCTEAPKGLTATHMDYRSRNMEYGIRISLPQYNKNIPKNKSD